MADQPFMTDIQTLRARARQHIEQGAVTQGYSADRDTVIHLLQEALATEIICVLRYKRHYFMASGINAQSVAQEFLQHATEEQMHADQAQGPDGRRKQECDDADTDQLHQEIGDHGAGPAEPAAAGTAAPPPTVEW